MTTEDVTRHLHQPWKHYAGTRLQTARPTIDSDFNENAIVDDEDLRHATLAVVGPLARLDSGFLPALKVGDTLGAKLVRFGAFFQAFVLDFDLEPGTMYVGGRRYEQPRLESVVFQREYLQIGPATAPRAVVGTHRQLAILRAWEQPVSAVEDAELLEPALGGADGGVRIRTMRRVEVRSVEAEGCEEAFAEVLAQLSEGAGVEHDPATYELRSTARLQLAFHEPLVDHDCPACTPSLRGRYLGRENHTIRVMLATPESYVWAFDDAAPLHRVRLVVDGGGGAHVEMQTPPKDAWHHPRIGTVVEFLPWAALLDNGTPQGGKLVGESVHAEKVATRTGFFAEVDAPYVPAEHSLHVRLAPDAALQLGLLPGKDPAKAKSKALQNLKGGANPAADVIALRWDEQHPLASELNPAQSEVEGFEGYVYMRIWHRKAPDAPLAIPTTPPRPLGTTGLLPSFSGPGRAGDYWVMSVRPSAPAEIIPRELMREGGVPPHGPREVVVPVSLLKWQSSGGLLHTLVAMHDCRPRMPALTDRGCDTFVVGPAGAGDYTSIQAAIDALPRHGGRIRVLAGDYAGELRIAGRRDVTIVGCGARTRITSPVVVTAEALVTIVADEGQGNITLRGLSLVARGQLGIAARGERLVFERLEVRTEALGAVAAASALRILEGRDVRIVRNRFVMDGSLGDHACIYIESPGLGVLVEDNDIEVEAGVAGSRLSWGGIHLGGGSREIDVRGNRITGGRGHGITLGSVVFRALDGRELRLQGAGRGQSDLAAPFGIHGQLAALTVTEIDPVTGVPVSTVFYPDPQPVLENTNLVDNEITAMGGSGISTLAVAVEHPPVVGDPPLCIRRRTFAVQSLVVADNRIENNVLVEPTSLQEPQVLGGVVLSEVIDLSVARNRIQGNGRDPSVPCCGIFVGAGRRISITGNHLADNGDIAGAVVPAPGVRRGGIVMQPPPLLPEQLMLPAIRDVLVRDNVVMQPVGPAVALLVVGTCTVTHNHLEGLVVDPSLGLGSGAVVRIVNAGQPWEAVDLPVGEPSSDRWIQPERSAGYLQERAQSLPGPGGGVLFSHNHVTSGWFGLASPSALLHGLAVMLMSMDAVSMLGNQLSARAPERTFRMDALVLGPTVSAVDNRIAEGLATPISLATAALLINVTSGNLLTHCFSAHGASGTGYLQIGDNLVLLTPFPEGCNPHTLDLEIWLSATLESYLGNPV
jgi:hypothetical protein